MAKVLIKKLDPAVELPAYKTEGASGRFDGISKRTHQS